MAYTSEPKDRIARFGSFEANIQESRLTKGGIRIRLQEQPFQILVMLLERPGQLVTREELRQRLWSQNTFVEFDDALNTAVRKLRTALGDSADNPRFLETVPRRGYRFVAPVTLPTEPRATEEQSTNKSGGTDVAADKTLAWPATFTKPSRMSVGLYLGAALLIACIVGALWYFRRPSFLITPKDTLVLADFVNSTGEPVFDDALRQGLQVGLAQSPLVQLLPDRKASIILKQMGHSADEPMSGRIALEVCQRTGSKVTVQGSIASLGSNYLIGLAAIRCDTGELIANEQVQAKGKEEVIDMLGRATEKLRVRLGESLPSIKKYNAPLEQATTPSLDALNAYGLALSVWDRKGDEASIPFFNRAIELDPNFAMAYGALGTVYHNRNESKLAQDYTTKAYELRDRVTEAERISIESRYFLYVLGNLEKAAQVYELAVQNYPQSAGALNHLGTTYAELGQYDKAADTLREALLLDPTRATTYSNLATDLLAQNRVDEAVAVLESADQRNLQTDFLLQVKYWVAFVRGDRSEMQRILLRSPDIAGAQSLLLAEQSNTEAFYGHYEKARQLTEVAVGQMDHDGDLESAADCLAIAALREAEVGADFRARTYIVRALKLARSESVLDMAALVTARIGDISQAEAQSSALSLQFPTQTITQHYWLPTIRAAIYLRQDQPGKAVEELRDSAPLELVAQTYSVPMLYPVYIRGQAYLKMGDEREATAEFQKFLERPGLVINWPMAALARLELARTYASAKEPAKARDAYHRFLDLWKDADPEIPILQRAVAESSKLE